MAIEKNDAQQSTINNQQSTIRFEIEDSGPGIAPEEIGMLFETFSQTATGRQTQEGTGLGLAISQKFVHLMGGDLTVKSEVGHGTNFTFHIQCKLADSIDKHQAPSVKQVVALQPGQPRYRLLVVDDKPDNRHLLIKLLEPLGFELREAENGSEAIDVWKQWRPHLIWMDLRMPEMDGYEATEQIRATPEGNETKIIVLSASSIKNELEIALSKGCDGFLRKPFRASEIFTLLEKHLGLRFVYEEEQKTEDRRHKTEGRKPGGIDAGCVCGFAIRIVD